MSFESTPGISTLRVDHPKRYGRDAHTENLLVFDLSKMTLATAFANPAWVDAPLGEWSIEQLFQVMFAPGEEGHEGFSKDDEEEAKALRPVFLKQFRRTIAGNPLNDEAMRHAARHNPRSSTAIETIGAFRSTYSTPENPDETKSTLLHISAEDTLLQLGAAAIPRVRDDLFRPRLPSGGLVSYIVKFREQNLQTLPKLIAKNDRDVRKVLQAMAYVQQINTCLTFTEDLFQADRTKVWADFFDKVEPKENFFLPTSEEDKRKLFLEGGNLCEKNLNGRHLQRLREFRKNQVDPLIKQLGEAAAWARAPENDHVEACASAKARDKEAKKLLEQLRNDSVICDALDNYEKLQILEPIVLSSLLEDIFELFSRCPGALEELLETEFAAVARGAVDAAEAIPKLPEGSTRQKVLTKALSKFDPGTFRVKKPNPLTKVIEDAFDRYTKLRSIPPPIISLWAHSTPSILARFDKLKPDGLNSEGTAYLLRSVFGMGLMDSEEMDALYSDLDAAIESAVQNGPRSPKTKQKLKQIFEEDLSHGRYPVRSLSWSDSRFFNSVKVALGLVGMRQGLVSVADGAALPHEGFIKFTESLLSSVGAARELRAITKEVSRAGRLAVGRAPSFLDSLPKTAKLGCLTELVGVLSRYHAVSKTPESSLERDHATADLAVAYLSLMVVVFETTLATSFPVAGLALILLRWVLFDQDLWNLIGNVTSAPPPAKVVRGILDEIESGKMGKLLREAPNGKQIALAIERMRVRAPLVEEKDRASQRELFFHIETDHADALREYATLSYGLTEDVSKILIED